MPTQTTRNIPEEIWLTHQQTLKRLWVDEDKTLLGEHGVIEIMERDYNFSAS